MRKIPDFDEFDDIEIDDGDQDETDIFFDNAADQIVLETLACVQRSSLLLSRKEKREVKLLLKEIRALDESISLCRYYELMTSNDSEIRSRDIEDLMLRAALYSEKAKLDISLPISQIIFAKIMKGEKLYRDEMSMVDHLVDVFLDLLRRMKEQCLNRLRSLYPVRELHENGLTHDGISITLPLHDAYTRPN